MSRRKLIDVPDFNPAAIELSGQSLDCIKEPVPSLTGQVKDREVMHQQRRDEVMLGLPPVSPMPLHHEGGYLGQQTMLLQSCEDREL
jgi:hypothetical protein